MRTPNERAAIQDEIWAKFRRDDPTRWHSLAGHGADIAACALALLNVGIVSERLAALAQRPLTSRDCARLAALAFFHDFGKANRGFQAKRDPQRLRSNIALAGHIREVAPLFSDDSLRHRISAVLPFEAMQDWCGAAFDRYLLA